MSSTARRFRRQHLLARRPPCPRCKAAMQWRRVSKAKKRWLCPVCGWQRDRNPRPK